MLAEGVASRFIEIRGARSFRRKITRRPQVFPALAIPTAQNIRHSIYYDLVGIVIVKVVIIVASLTITAIIVATTSTTATLQRKNVSRQTLVSAPRIPIITEAAVTRIIPHVNRSAITAVVRKIQKRSRRCKSKTTRSSTIPWVRSITRTLCAFWWKSTKPIKSASTRHISAELNSRMNEPKTNALNRSPRKPTVN